MILILILTFTIYNLIVINYSLKDIENQLSKKMVGTNSLITTSTNDKKINSFVSRLNEDLKRLRNKELQYDSGNQELYRMMTNISHDLRTPLTAIRGYVELLKKEKNEKKIKKYIDIIDMKSLELTNLTEQLFDYSRCFDLKDLMVLEKVCLNDLLEEVILSYYGLFQDNKITPNISLCRRKVYKMIDKTMLIRILENILSNVIKYADGKVDISLLDDGKIIFVNRADALDSVSVKKIFNRYFTVENAQKSTGVGLSIAKQLTELNGGKIRSNYKDGNLILELEFK